MSSNVSPTGTELYIVNTGDWRTHRPERSGKCSNCGICFLYCPTGSIRKADGKWVIDLEYCKGCGICSNECPAKCILMVEEGVKTE